MPTIELDYAPYEYQKLLHSSATRWNLVVGGRRVGKSKMALQEMVKHCLEVPKAVAWWVAPTYAMAREVGWEEFLAYKGQLEPGIVKIHETNQTVRFRNGSIMQFKGGDSEHSLRGRGLTFLVIDEAAFVDELVWTRALRPALADKNGRALLISTPNGRNWFYNLAVHAERDESWTYFHWPTPMNPLIGPEELQEAAASISEIDFRQEFMAEFITRAGMVYDEFSADNIVAPGTPFPHDYDIYLGIDFGFANPTAVCFMAVGKMADGQDHVIMFDEVYVARRKMEEITALILQTLRKHHLAPHDVRAVYTDPAGNAAELSSGVSPVDYLRHLDFGWTVLNKKSEIAPGVALVRSFIRNAAGIVRFHITNNCVQAIRSLSGYTYDKRESSEVVKEEPLKDGVHDHMCDAVRYFFVNRFDQAKWVARVPTQTAWAEETTPGKKNMKQCLNCHQHFLSSTPKESPPYLCKECTTHA